jgi:signal-transduction protein with cAMP-binding, CBS, and nucleotidyltransferase domain
VPQGTNEWESKKDFTIRKAKVDEITHWAVFTDIEDNNGLPKSIEKLKEKVQKSLDSLGGPAKLDLRKAKEKDGVTFFKRK